jgi:hypothetical protein
MEFQGVLVGIIGGVGLGLIIGCKFSGSTISIVGGIFVLFSIVEIISRSVKAKKAKHQSKSYIERNNKNRM